MAKNNRKDRKFAEHERRLRVARLYVQGRTQAEISAETGFCQATVCRDLKWVHREWLKGMVASFDARKARTLAGLDELERANWEGWRRSLRNAETVTVKREEVLLKEEAGNGEGNVTTLTPTKRSKERRRSGQAGDPRFLANIAAIVDTRCKIFGYYRDVTVNENHFNLNWTALAAPPGEADPLEARLALPALPAPRLAEGGGELGDGENGAAEHGVVHEP